MSPFHKVPIRANPALAGGFALAVRRQHTAPWDMPVSTGAGLKASAAGSMP
jgi:hypothetical protein